MFGYIVMGEMDRVKTRFEYFTTDSFSPIPPPLPDSFCFAHQKELQTIN
jgi:hypothetical protein